MNKELRKRLVEIALTEDRFVFYSEAARILHIEADRLDRPRELAIKVINHYGDEVLKVYEV